MVIAIMVMRVMMVMVVDGTYIISTVVGVSVIPVVGVAVSAISKVAMCVNKYNTQRNEK